MEILQNLGLTAIITTGSVFVIKLFISNVFSKDLEVFKSALQDEAVEFKTRYESLHSERAAVIKETYRRIVETQRDFESLMNPRQPAGEPTEAKKRQKAADSFEELSRYFHVNEIFFDQKLAADLNEFINRLQETWKKFHRQKFDSKGEPYRDVDEWQQVWSYTQKEIPELKKAIEEKFRSIIGIEDEEL